MSDYDQAVSDGVMIALLPVSSEWCEIEFPHLTLVYAGKTGNLSPSDFSMLAKDAAMLAMLCRPFTLTATGIDIFGGGDDPLVNVLKFRNSPELMAVRRIVEHWNKSEHPFNPHCTIGEQKYRNPMDYPRVVGFDRIAVGWGDEYMTFWLNKSY